MDKKRQKAIEAALMEIIANGESDAARVNAARTLLELDQQIGPKAAKKLDLSDHDATRLEPNELHDELARARQKALSKIA